MAFIDAKVNSDGLSMDKLFPEITDSDIKSALNDIAKDGKAQMRSAQEIHKAWCDYMINKASAPQRITSIRTAQKLTSGIKSNRMTRNEIILALAK